MLPREGKGRKWTISDAGTEAFTLGVMDVLDGWGVVPVPFDASTTRGNVLDGAAAAAADSEGGMVGCGFSSSIAGLSW